MKLCEPVGYETAPDVAKCIEQNPWEKAVSVVEKTAGTKE
ncbi:hypothetical protein T4C_9362 [Trichinella pseudospiralis]|uniref:Uncharacterized protein n=1 Tax=Trichinella pseudospiralis TaxID=6337 RepID=A0A0V1GFZ8_TRIPS|nr:hypothetical protein T4C_9362 [Trichinella pseudospiralis]